MVTAVLKDLPFPSKGNGGGPNSFLSTSELSVNACIYISIIYLQNPIRTSRKFQCKE